MKRDLSHRLREAAKQDIENDPRFLKRIEKARESLRAGRGVRLESLKSGR